MCFFLFTQAKCHKHKWDKLWTFSHGCDGIEQLGLSNSAVFEKQCDQQNLNNAVL